MQIYRKNSFFRNFGPLVGAEDITIFEKFLDIFGAHTNGQLLVAITYQNSEKSIFRSTLARVRQCASAIKRTRTCASANERTDGRKRTCVL